MRGFIRNHRKGRFNLSSTAVFNRIKDCFYGPNVSPLRSTRLWTASLVGVTLVMTSCQQGETSLAPRSLNVKQNWELKPGRLIAGHRITGGLGDVSIEVKGQAVYAPFSGTLQAHNVGSSDGQSGGGQGDGAQPDCAIFSSPEIPAYVLRLCGLHRPKFGDLEQGKSMGSSRMLQFAALRKQPSGEWAIVEPASDILERILSP